MLTHLLPQRPMNRASEVLRINIENQLLAKRVAQLRLIVLGRPCLMPIFVDITIVIGRLGPEINQIILEFGKAPVFVDNYGPRKFATIFLGSNAGVPSDDGREDKGRLPSAEPVTYLRKGKLARVELSPLFDGSNSHSIGKPVFRNSRFLGRFHGLCLS